MVGARVHVLSCTVRPQEQQHNGSGALPAAAGVLIVHVRVVGSLLQPYNEVDITDNVAVAVMVLALAVLELSVHWIPFPWSPGTATSVAELHASLGPVMVGGAGVGYMLTVILLDLTAGHWALALASA